MDVVKKKEHVSGAEHAPLRSHALTMLSVVAENRVSGSGAVSGRPRSRSGAESGCQKIGVSGEREIGRSRSADMLCRPLFTTDSRPYQLNYLKHEITNQ